MSPMKVSSCISLITISTLVLISLRRSAANHGVDFIVSLPGSDNPEAMMYMYMTPYDTDSKVTLTWTLSNKPAAYSQAIIAGSSVQTVQLGLNSTPSAIHISATHPVIVVVTVVFANDKVYSMATYLASPADELSSTYTVITHCGPESCNLVIANGNDNAELTVTLTLTPNTANITYNGKTYYNGDVIYLTLRDLEAVQINSGVADLTGSVVSSSRPTQVVSGSGLILTSTTNHNIMIEQMPIQRTLGTKFILINAVSKSNVVATVKVAFTQQNTSISFEGSSLMLLVNTSTWITYHFTKEPLVVLLTDKPAIVEIVYEVKPKGKVNSMASVIITPVDSWASNYVTLMHVGSISIVTTDSCISNILFNKNVLGSTEWTQASTNPEYYYATKITTSHNIAKVLLEGQMGCTFGGYVMYENEDGFTVFPLGWKKVELESSIPSLSGSTESVKPSAMTYVPSESQSLDIIVHSSQSLHSSALDVEVTVTKTLAMVSSAVPLPSYYITSEDVLYSGPSLFVELVTDAVSTDFTNSQTASSFLASTSNMKEPSVVSQRSTFSTSNSITKGTNAHHCGNRCDSNLNNSTAVTQFLVTPLSLWNGHINPHNISDAPRNTVKPTNTTWIEYASMFNASKLSTSSSQLLKDETSTSFLQPITASTYIQFNTENLGSSVKHMNTKVSRDIILSETSTPSSMLHSEWIVISKASQFITENALATKMTTRMSTNTLTTVSFMDISRNTKPYFDIKTTTEILTGDQADEIFNVTIGYTCKCPCRCRSKYYLSWVANATTLPVIITDIEKNLLLERRLLIAYRMSKISLYNRQQSAKYIGSTLGILVLVSMFGLLFSSDIFSLCCKKSYTTHV